MLCLLFTSVQRAKIKSAHSTTRKLALTSIILDFQHRFLTDVESTNIKSINVNISYKNQC